MQKITIMLIVLILMTSCSTNANISQTYTSIEECINLLTDKSFDGRRPGTEGNVKAQKYLKESLKNINVQPYSDSYYREFSYIFYNVADAKIEVDNEDLNFQKDFQIRYSPGSSVNMAYVLRSEPITGEKCILLTEEKSKSVSDDEEVQAVILNVKEFEKLELIYEADIKNKPVIVVEEETYKKLNEKLNHDISIKIDLEKNIKLIITLSE